MPHRRIDLMVARYGLAAITAALAACRSSSDPGGIDTTKPPKTVGTLPADNPGTMIAAPGDGRWGVAWNQVNGRLIIPRFRSGDVQPPPAPRPVNFAIVRVDPAQLSADTIVVRDDATLSYLQVGSTTGRVFFSYSVPGPNGSSSRFSRVEHDGGNLTDISLPAMFSRLVISPDEAWGFAQTVANVPFHYGRLSLASGAASGSVSAFEVIAVSPEGTHVLDGRSMTVIGIDGSGRALEWSNGVPATKVVLRAAWIDGTVRLLIASTSTTATGTSTSLHEWDEGSETARHLGTVHRSSDEFSLKCVAWRPESSRAAVVMDSIDAGTLEVYRRQWAMTLLASGQARTFGTFNSDSFLTECSLSPDGSWLAIRPWTHPGRVYVKRIE